MSVLVVLTVILFLAMRWVGEERGTISFVSLFLNLGLMFITVLFITNGFPPLVIVLLLIFYVVNKLKVQGLGEDELFEMDMYSLKVGIDFVTISSCMIVMSTIGAINDTAMSIASGMNEVYHYDPKISQKELFLSGMRVGRDILGTTTNTLFFAFLGSSLALLIWVKDLNYSLTMILNSKVMAGELASILFSGMGVTLIIPMTGWLMAVKLTSRPKESK
ncbi:YibE/F family protein [Vagococcus salmoninarum]|uniref:YibE/F family protein n=1 Tax=Vagococcus salmoninarum TaxID=2739 RepID=UPI003F993AB1